MSVVNVRRRKYGNTTTTVDGHAFDSLAEAARYQQLHLREREGQIAALTVHPTFKLLDGFRDVTGKWHTGIVYEADFSYVELPTTEGARIVVEDVKGVVTAVFSLKRRLFLAKFGRLYDLRVISAKTVR